MRTTIKLFTVFALVLATFSQYRTASAADIFKFKGQSVSAFFSTVDPSGCLTTNMIIFAGEDGFRAMPDPGETTSWIELAISQYDACTQTELLDAEGFASLADSDLQVSRKLDWATLNATVNVVDEATSTPISFDVSINLAWIGTGPLTYENSAFPFHSAGCNINSHFNGTSRPAEASGIVSDGRTNFTPEPSVDDYTYIRSNKYGVVSIGCD